MEPFYWLKANPRHLLQELSWRPAISNYIPIVQGPCLLPLPVPTYLQVKPIVDWEKNYIYFCGKKVVHTRTQISRKSTSLSKKRQYKHQTWCEWHWRCLEYNTSRDKNHISLPNRLVLTLTSPYFGSPISTSYHLRTCEWVIFRYCQYMPAKSNISKKIWSQGWPFY